MEASLDAADESPKTISSRLRSVKRLEAYLAAEELVLDPACVRAFLEPFSSFDLAGLKDVDGFGELPGFPGAASEFAQDVPGLELGVGAFGGRA